MSRRISKNEKNISYSDEKGRGQERKIDKKLHKYEKKLRIFFLILLAIAFIIYLSHNGFAVSTSDFSYAIPITITNPDADNHYNETILIGFNPLGKALSTCKDIHIFNGTEPVDNAVNGTMEYVYYNCSSTYAETVFRIPQINSNQNLTSYKIYFGNKSSLGTSFSYNNSKPFYINQSFSNVLNFVINGTNAEANNFTYEQGAKFKMGRFDVSGSVKICNITMNNLVVMTTTNEYNCKIVGYQNFSAEEMSLVIKNYKPQANGQNQWAFGFHSNTIFSNGDRHISDNVPSISTEFYINMEGWVNYFTGATAKNLQFLPIQNLVPQNLSKTGGGNIPAVNFIYRYYSNGTRELLNGTLNKIYSRTFFFTDTVNRTSSGFFFIQTPSGADTTGGHTDTGYNITDLILTSGIWYWNESTYSLGSTQGSQTNIIPCFNNNATHIVIYNFSLYNETSLSKYQGSFNANFNLTNVLSGNSYINTFNLTNTNNMTLCISKDDDYFVDAFIQYFGTGFSDRWYFLNHNSANGTQNITQNIPLYSLSTSLGNSVYFKVIDSTGGAVANAYIYINRYYPEENLYRLVAIGKTDDNGQDTIFLRMNDVWYTIQLWKDLQLKFNSAQTKITTGNDPTLPLTFSISSTGALSTYANRIAQSVVSLNFNNATRVWTGTFSDPTGASSQWCLRVDESKPMGSQICNTCLNSASGILTCTVPSYPSAWSAVLTSSGSPEDSSSGFYQDLTTIGSQIGKFGLFILFFFLLFMVLVGVPNPIVALVYGLFAVLLTSLFNITTINAGVVGTIIGLFALVIWRMSKS